MIQVLESNKKPSFGQKFSNAVGSALNTGLGLYQEHQKNRDSVRLYEVLKAYIMILT
jgi:hypothetical protein